MKEIKTVYDEDTQNLIDFYNKIIADMTEEHTKRMQSASNIALYGMERLKREYEADIKPYRDKLLEITLKAVPKYIMFEKEGDKD